MLRAIVLYEGEPLLRREHANSTQTGDSAKHHTTVFPTAIRNVLTGVLPYLSEG